MPLYEYFCSNCQEKSERFVTYGKRLEQFCDTCNTKLQKLISSSPNFKFVGSGFFCNDYSKDPNLPPTHLNEANKDAFMEGVKSKNKEKQERKERGFN